MLYRKAYDKLLEWKNQQNKKALCIMGARQIGKKGMRLRLDISSSNFPEYSAHPNTDKGWAYEATPQIAHQKILSGTHYSSKLILPIDDVK